MNFADRQLFADAASDLGGIGGKNNSGYRCRYGDYAQRWRIESGRQVDALDPPAKLPDLDARDEKLAAMIAEAKQ
jgi:hypothetical protein